MELRIVNIETQKVIHTVPISPGRDIDKVMCGLMINMDTDRYYIDDSDFDEEL